jgi:hypothetical protein
MVLGKFLGDYLYLPLLLLVGMLFENFIFLRDMFISSGAILLWNLLGIVLIIGITFLTAFTYTFKVCSLK